MIAHARQRCSQPPTPSFRIDQHATRRPAAADNVEVPIVRHHPMSPARLDHLRQRLPFATASSQSPEIGPRRPMLMTEAHAGDVGAATYVHIMPKPRRGKMVARSRQRRTNGPGPALEIIDRDGSLGLEETRKPADHVQALRLGTCRGLAGVGISDRGRQLASSGWQRRAERPTRRGPRLRMSDNQPCCGADTADDDDCEDQK